MTINELFALTPQAIALLSDEQLKEIIAPHLGSILPLSTPPSAKELFTPEQLIAQATQKYAPLRSKGKKSTEQLLAENQAMLLRIQSLRKKS